MTQDDVVRRPKIKKRSKNPKKKKGKRIETKKKRDSANGGSKADEKKKNTGRACSLLARGCHCLSSQDSVGGKPLGRCEWAGARQLRQASGLGGYE